VFTNGCVGKNSAGTSYSFGPSIGPLAGGADVETTYTTLKPYGLNNPFAEVLAQFEYGFGQFMHWNLGY
jgi:hypothetical protein